MAKQYDSGYELKDLEVPIEKYPMAESPRLLENFLIIGYEDIYVQEVIYKNVQNNVMEINVNKMSFNQLKELDKYLNKCIKDNNSNITSPLEKKLDFSNSKIFDEEKECDILKNDDLSSCLSDDEDEEDEE